MTKPTSQLKFKIGDEVVSITSKFDKNQVIIGLNLMPGVIKIFHEEINMFEIEAANKITFGASENSVFTKEQAKQKVEEFLNAK